MNPNRRRRALISIPAILVTAIAAVGLTAPPAWADTTVSDVAELETAVGDIGNDGQVIALGADISSPTLALHMLTGVEMTIDLMGHDLTLRELVMRPGNEITLTDTSTGTPGILSVEDTDDWEGGIRTTGGDLIIEGAIVVHAQGGGGTAGIGGGDEPRQNAGNVTIQGDAVVVAKGGNQAAGIGGGQSGNSGLVTISGNAHVTATGGTSAAGIGGAAHRAAATIAIDGDAVVIATGTSTGAGIGGGNQASMGTVTISGSAHVTATGGDDGGSGIGGGDLGDGGTLTISDDAVVVATGKGGNAGLGAAEDGDGGAITIQDDADVTATGGAFGAGIATGGVDDLGTVTITDDATVTATGGTYGAGIGGNAADPGGSIVIGGGSAGLVTVSATGGQYASGIGGGWLGDGGDVTIGTNSSVTASGGENAVGAGLFRTDLGTLDVDGNLVIPTGQTLKMPESTDTITGDGYITGDGSIANGGSIQVPEAHVMVPVTGHNYVVTLALVGGGLTPPAASVRVLATSFTKAAQALPEPTRPGYVLSGWKKGTAAFTAASTLSGPATITAQWASFAGSIPAPTLSGTPKVGETLTADATGWPLGTTFTYRWLRSGKVVVGETASTYLLGPADYLKQLQVEVTGTAPLQPAVAKTSAKTAKVAAALLTPAYPNILGTLEVGETLTADAGSWAPITPAFTYQWYIDGAPVAKATASTWKIPGTALGKLISVKVTGSSLGYATKPVLGQAFTNVAFGTMHISSSGGMSGSVQTGQRLSAVLPSITPAPVYTYQWNRDGFPIVGATASTYLIPADAQGATFDVLITGSLVGYQSIPISTTPTAPALGSFTAPTPKITGTARVGQTLTAVPGAWNPTAAFTYEWLRVSGSTVTVIPGAGAPTYQLVTADKGKTIKVRITGTAGGIGQLIKTSAATAKVL